MGPQNSWPPVGNCQNCGKRIKWTEGIFCANFCWSVGRYNQCQAAWCGKCYTSDRTITYHKERDPRITQENLEDEGDVFALWKSKGPSPQDFDIARPGDHLICPFLCDLCIFHIVRQEEPQPESHQDKVLLSHIRRVNLDAFWSRSRSTVKNNARIVRQTLADARSHGMFGPYRDPGPAPLWDICGYEIAICMITDSLRSGKYSESHKQWDTIRRVKSSVSNQEKTNFNDLHQRVVVMEDTKGGTQRLFGGRAGSFWLSRFQQGCRLRMGQETRQNQALSTPLVKGILEYCETKVNEEEDPQDMIRWAKAGALFTISYVLSLRGNEGILVDIEGLLEHDSERNGLLAVPVTGKLKGTGRVQKYILRSVSITSSGINVGWWVQLLRRTVILSGAKKGPAFCDNEGFVWDSIAINEMLHEALEAIYTTQRNLFPLGIQTVGEVRLRYGIYRSFRRASDSRAVSQNVSELDIQVVNRWSKKERSKGQKMAERMELHYADQNLLDECFCRYTSAM